MPSACMLAPAHAWACGSQPCTLIDAHRPLLNILMTHLDKWARDLQSQILRRASAFCRLILNRCSSAPFPWSLARLCPSVVQ